MESCAADVEVALGELIAIISAACKAFEKGPEALSWAAQAGLMCGSILLIICWAGFLGVAFKEADDHNTDRPTISYAWVLVLSTYCFPFILLLYLFQKCMRESDGKKSDRCAAVQVPYACGSRDPGSARNL